MPIVIGQFPRVLYFSKFSKLFLFQNFKLSLKLIQTNLASKRATLQCPVFGQLNQFYLLGQIIFQWSNSNFVPSVLVWFMVSVGFSVNTRPATQKAYICAAEPFYRIYDGTERGRRCSRLICNTSTLGELHFSQLT